MTSAVQTPVLDVQVQGALKPVGDIVAIAKDEKEAEDKDKSPALLGRVKKRMASVVQKNLISGLTAATVFLVSLFPGGGPPPTGKLAGLYHDVNGHGMLYIPANRGEKLLFVDGESGFYAEASDLQKLGDDGFYTELRYFNTGAVAGHLEVGSVKNCPEAQFREPNQRPEFHSYKRTE